MVKKWTWRSSDDGNGEDMVVDMANTWLLRQRRSDGGGGEYMIVEIMKLQ